MKTFFSQIAIVVVVSLSISSANAGVYGDEMAKCLVESTTPEDRTDLVRWMFVAISLHPAVETLSSISDEQMNTANKGAADLFMRLLTESCRDETEKALQYEGQAVLETSFGVLGQVAGAEIFAAPEVGEVLAGLEGYMDAEKLSELKGLQ